MFTFPTPSPNSVVFITVRSGPSEDNLIRPEDKDTEEPKFGCWSFADNAPLHSKGIAMAEETNKVFAGVKFDAITCSPAYKAVQTAKLVVDKQDLKLEINEALAEMEIGVFGGELPGGIELIFQFLTGYPDPSTKEFLPNLWKKRDGRFEHGNDALLDYWLPFVAKRVDVSGEFEGLQEPFISTTKDLFKKNLGKDYDPETFDQKWAECLNALKKTLPDHIAGAVKYGTFADFYNTFTPEMDKMAEKYLGKTVLVVPQGSATKSFIGRATNIPIDRIEAAKGCYHVTVATKKNVEQSESSLAEWEWTWISELSKGIKLEE